jgi:aldose sugar dehydrogenase
MRTLPALLLFAFPVAFAQSQQPQNIGVAPVTLTESAYVFDSAEQHKIRVVVVAKGLKHPFAIAPLPSGDALVSERGGPMWLVHSIGGGTPGLHPEPITGLPPVEPAYRGGGLHDIVLSPRRSARRAASPCSAAGCKVMR